MNRRAVFRLCGLLLCVCLPVAACAGEPPDADSPIRRHVLAIESVSGPVRVRDAAPLPVALPAAETAVGLCRFKSVTVQPGCWYELTVSYCQDHAETREQNALAAILFTFHRGSQPVATPHGIAGLRTGTTGLLYRYVPSTHYLAGGSADPTAAPFTMTFRVPPEATSVQVAVRNWKNRHPLRLGLPELQRIPSRPAAAAPVPDFPPRRTSDAVVGTFLFPDADSPRELDRHEVLWCALPVAPGYRYVLQGRLSAQVDEKPHRALVRVRFADRAGAELPPPYPETRQSTEVGAYHYLPTDQRTTTFALPLVAPAGAHTVRLGFQGWYNAASVQLLPDVMLSVAQPPAPDAVLAACGLWDTWTTAHRDGLASADLARALLTALLEHWGPATGPADPPGDIVHRYVGPPGRAPPVRPVYGTGLSVDNRADGALAEGTLRLLNFEPVPLPREPTWTEDPFRSVSWRQRYQSLYWLLGFVSNAPAGPDLDSLRHYLGSWLAVNTWPRYVDAYAYDDHAIAMRAEFLVMLLASMPTLAEEHPDLAAQVVALLVLHGLLLDDLLDQPAFLAHNHGLFHARALLMTALALPQGPFSSHWRTRAVARLRELVDLLYHDDGVSVEQAASYHFLVTRVFIRTYLSLRKTGAVPADLRDAMCETIAKALHTAAWMVHPNGRLVRVGDTEEYGEPRQEIRALLEGELSESCFAPEWPARRPPVPVEDAWVSTASGFAAFRTARAGASRLDYAGSAPHDDSYLFIDFTPQVFSHGHYDATSFEYSVDGTRWIVDSGGPYRYDTSCRRQYIVSSRAHNVCLPDGREQTDGEAWIVARQHREDYHLLVIGTNVHGAAYWHLRRFVVLPDVRAVAVTDFFRKRAGDLALACYLHFDPEVRIVLDGDDVLSPTLDGKRILLTAWDPTGHAVGVYVARGEGECGCDMLGWVSRQQAVLEPAPTLRYETRGHESAEMTVLLAGDEPALTRVREIVQSLPPLSGLDVPPDEAAE